MNSRTKILIGILSIGIILISGWFIWRPATAEIIKKPLGGNFPPEMTINFWVDKEGGMYSCPSADPSKGGCRYAEYIRPLLKSQDVKKLILVGKYVPTPAFIQEFLTLLKEARENQKVLEIKEPCLPCSCKGGMTSVIYDYQDKEVQMQTSKKTYSKGEKVSFMVNNPSSFDRSARNVLVEREAQGKWMEADSDANCPCLAECDYYIGVLQGQKSDSTWDQIVYDNGCVKASPGKYRFVILGLSGWKDKEMCERHDSVVYSNVFEIKE